MGRVQADWIVDVVFAGVGGKARASSMSGAKKIYV